MISIGTPLLWSAFALAVIALLAIDLFIMGGGHRHKVSMKEAAGWSMAWVCTALAFNAGLWYYLDLNQGRELANDIGMKFLAGYLLEKSLAVDNIFVWILIFGYFQIPLELQRRVLLYGIAGALILRTSMIFGGSWLIQQFEWILYLFGAFLIYTGIKMLIPEKEEEPNLQDNFLLRWLTKHLNITEGLRGEHFTLVENGKRYFTPLLLALILVEISDVVFAVDSIPAVFAVTTDPFIVLTSNIFAILGLRAMYFFLAGAADKLVYLNYGLAFIMAFIGSKMLLVQWFHVPIALSLSVIAGVLTLTVLASLYRSRSTQD
ncbi:MAG: TerC family protein [Venatoribacter sp.]